MQETKRSRFNPWVGKISWSRKWQSTPVFLPGKSHGQRSLGGLQSMGLQRVTQDLVTPQHLYYSTHEDNYICVCVCASTCVYVCVCLVLSDSLQPHGLQPARLLCPWDSPGKNTRVGCHFLLQGNLPDPGIEPTSLALAGGFFTAEPLGKPINGLDRSLQMVTAAMKLRRLLLGRKAMTKLDSILKSRDITLPTKVHLVKAMVFPMIMY